MKDDGKRSRRAFKPNWNLSRKREPGLHVVVVPGVGGRVARTVRHACRRLSRVIEVRHSVDVVIAPFPVICDEDGKFGAGVFTTFTGQPAIVLGRPPRALPPNMGTRRDLILAVLAHEIAHYEQFRDRRRLQERGVNVRGRSLLRSAGLLAGQTVPLEAF